jgi:hypothetical protein
VIFHARTIPSLLLMIPSFLLHHYLT